MARLSPTTAFLQAASLVVVAAVGVALVTRSVGAQQPPAGAGARHAGGGHALTASAADGAVERATDATVDGGGGGALADRGDGGVRVVSATASARPDARSARDYTVTQTEDDFDPNMSPEERRSLGSGPVPIHREGRYRSALAHPRFGTPTEVRVGLVLNTVRNYDITRGTYEADFFLSLMGDHAMPDIHLAIPNGNVTSMYTLVDAPTLKVYRITALLSSPVDLRAYPFDTQELVINVEDQRAGVDQLVFTADGGRTALDEDFDVAGWGVAYVGARAYRHRYPSRFDRDDLYVSRYKFVVGLDRFGTSAAFNVFVPAFVIILISLTGLWMPFAQIDVRSNTGAPMLAAAVLFHFSLKQSLPATGYLTRADKLMLGLYLALVLNMFSTWLFFMVPAEHHNTVFRWSRMLVPPVTLAVMVLATLV